MASPPPLAANTSTSATTSNAVGIPLPNQNPGPKSHFQVLNGLTILDSVFDASVTIPYPEDRDTQGTIKVQFRFNSKSYDMELTFSNTFNSYFMRRMIIQYPPRFGTLKPSNNLPDFVEDQAIDASCQFVRDVFFTLNKVFQHYESQVMNYACDYREKLRKLKAPQMSYAQYVDLKTMHFIVHSHFYGGRSDWDIHGFAESGQKKLKSMRL
jgi:hypothetical protein